MIRRVGVNKFKSIEALDLELGRLNVFVGANGSGKSNLLEAIGVLGAAAWGRVDDEALLRRGVRPGVAALYKTSFRGSRLPQQIRLTAESETATYQVGLWNPTKQPTWTYHSELLQESGQRLVGRSPASYERGDPTAGMAASRLAELDSPAASRLLAALREYCIYTPTSSAMRGLYTDPQSRPPVGLSGGRLAEGVEETLRSLSPAEREDTKETLQDLLGWISDVRVGLPEQTVLSRSVPAPRLVVRFRDRFMAEGRNELTGYDASEGALYVLFALVVCRHPAVPGICAIDNIDQGLNPRLARALMERVAGWILAREDRQILVTAHNPVTLDGLPLADDRVRLFTVDRTNKGRSVVRRVGVTPAMLAKAAAGWTLSRLWVAGELGGVPSV